jgi:uncharacterized protein YbaA (DUF1428 family)
MRITRYLWNLLLTLPALLAAEPVNAQSFGLANILNPEGTRLFPQLLIFPRHPGKPDPRWKAFDWKSTEQKVGNARYKLFFYEGENWGARFAIPRINEQIESLTESFGFTPPVTFNYLLFTSLREFRQANIFFISEGVQGITSTTESTMAIPFWGHVSNFDHISKHEMVHQFQVQKIRKLAGPDGEVVLGTIPLWFIEGMAEYYSQGGVDVETRQYIRDLLTSPKKDSELPKFFDPGPLSFVGVYKVGQVKNAFIEEEFGHGTIQRILETYSMVPTGPVPNFKVAVEALIGQNEEEIEKRWKNYIERHFRPEIEELAQPLDQFDPVYDAGENLDLYKVSPDGTLIATREVDPLSGIASIQLIDLKDNGRKIHIARDQEPSLLSLYFLQLPGLAISNNRIAYAYDTTSGPGIEIKNLSRDHSGKLEIGNPRRLELFRSGMIQVSSPAFSPDGHRITFVALKLHGWDNVYVIDPDDSSAKPRALTTDHYGWSDLSWGNAGIFGASERTSNGKDNIFRIDPGHSFSSNTNRP